MALNNTMAVFDIVCLILFLFASCSEGQYESCSTNRSVLERALFETGNNLNELDRVFFPLLMETSRFIIVNYTFLGEDNCSVLYVWSIGGALLIQPPTIFQLTSLLFSNPANDLVHLNLQLPDECRRLVNTSGNCSCKTDNSRSLGILTQQINEYVRYSDVSNVVRENILSSARAICTKNLVSEFYEIKTQNVKYHLYFGVILMLPILLLISGSTFGLKLFGQVEGRVFKKNHLNLVGLALTGTYVLLFIYATDIAAVDFYRRKDHEYSEFNVTVEHFNVWITAGTFVVNSLILAIHILILIILVIYRKRVSNPSEVVTMVWIALLLIPPSLSFTSHIGYILLAWLTEPSKATGAGFVAVGAVIFLFIVVKNTYEFLLSIDIGNVASKCKDPCKKLCTTLCRNLYENLKAYFNKKSDGSQESIHKFCFIAFILTFFLGLLPVLTICITLSAFYLIPLRTLPLTDYLDTFFQAVIIIFSTLISYEIISLHKKSDFHKFIDGFRETCNNLSEGSGQVTAKKPQTQPAETEKGGVDKVPQEQPELDKVKPQKQPAKSQEEPDKVKAKPEPQKQSAVSEEQAEMVEVPEEKPAISEKQEIVEAPEEKPAISEKQEIVKAPEEEPAISEKQEIVKASEEKPTISEKREIVEAPEEKPAISEKQEIVKAPEEKPAISEKQEIVEAPEEKPAISEKREIVKAPEEKPAISEKREIVKAPDEKPAVREELGIDKAKESEVEVPLEKPEKSLTQAGRDFGIIAKIVYNKCKKD